MCSPWAAFRGRALRETVAILSSFSELLQGYGLQPSDIQVIGTSALREASNRDTFIDRINLQAGFHVRIVEDIEETYLMYLAVKKALEDERSFLTRSNAMILEVGGGTTEVMLLKKGPDGLHHSLSIGTLRMDEQIRESARSRRSLSRCTRKQYKNRLRCARGGPPLDSVHTFVSSARTPVRGLLSLGEKLQPLPVLDRAQFLSNSPIRWRTVA